MRAARLHEFKAPLRVDDIPVPSARAGEVLVRIAAAGVCHSDLGLIAGSNPKVKLPLTLGHESAGYVEQIGEGASVRGLKRGDAVAVYSGWGCGECRFCQLREYHVCNKMLWAGYGADGGFAEFLRVPSARYLVGLNGLDPSQAAPLTDAGLTSYNAVTKTLPHLYPGAFAAIIGMGGLGHLALQVIKAVSPETRVIAIDVADEKLELASKLGADHTIRSDANAHAEIRRVTNGEGAQAIIDIVGTDETLGTAARAVGRNGIIVLVGLGGGTLPFSFKGMPSECTVVKNSWGSYDELVDLLDLARSGKVRVNVKSFPLEEINEVFRLLEGGRIEGRAVVVP